MWKSGDFCLSVEDSRSFVSIKNTLESLSVQILTAHNSKHAVLLADLKRILTRCRLGRRDKESLKHFPSKLVRNHTHMKAHAGTQTHTFGAQLRWVIRGGHQGNRQTQANIRYTAYLQQLLLCVSRHPTHLYLHHYLSPNMKTSLEYFISTFVNNDRRSPVSRDTGLIIWGDAILNVM